MLDNTVYMISIYCFFIRASSVVLYCWDKIFTIVVGVWDTQCLRLFVCVWFGDALDITRAITKFDESDFSWWADVLDSSFEGDCLTDVVSSEVGDEGRGHGKRGKGDKKEYIDMILCFFFAEVFMFHFPYSSFVDKYICSSSFSLFFDSVDISCSFKLIDTNSTKFIGSYPLEIVYRVYFFLYRISSFFKSFLCLIETDKRSIWKIKTTIIR